MARKNRTLNPANKNKTSEIIRFRGIAVDENEQMTDPAFVGDSDNLESFKLREMTVRPGQAKRATYEHGVTGGIKTIKHIVVTAGPNAYVGQISSSTAGGFPSDDQTIGGNLTPNEDIDFIKPITIYDPSAGGGSDADKFVSVWSTTAPAQTVGFRTYKDYGYDFTIDWGDGTTETYSNIAESGYEKVSHEYASAGDHIVRISGTLTKFRTYTGVSAERRMSLITNMGSTGMQYLDIDSCSALLGVDFGTCDMTACTFLRISDCSSILSIDMSGATFAATTDLNIAFAYNTIMSTFVSPASITPADGSEETFWECEALTTIDYTNWDFSVNKHMSSMHHNCPLDTASYDLYLQRCVDGGLLNGDADGSESSATGGLSNPARQTLISRGWNVYDQDTP